MASKGDYALEQEKYSAELIEKANSEQEGLLKLAKELATKELESYNEERRNMADNYRAANATHQKYFIPWSAYQNIRKNYS